MNEPLTKLFGLDTPEAYQLRDFLQRVDVPFEWICLTSDEEARLLAGVDSLADTRLPVCVLNGGTAFGRPHHRSTLFNPSVRDVAQALDWYKSPKFAEYDVVIFGAGPAGLSAAVYVASVAASCANGFGVAPYSIGDNRYIDGGYRADVNADLAAGYAPVLVLSPFGGRTRKPLDWGLHLAAQADELRAGGSRVETIFPDSDSRSAFGVNMMDPSTRPPAARAGYDQGRALAGQLTEFWR
jgi:hypothetical protein